MLFTPNDRMVIHGPLVRTPVIADARRIERKKNPFYDKAKELPFTGKKENPFYKEEPWTS